MKKRFEAKTLEDACLIASKELECSIADLDYSIIQYPSKGILGLFSKNAIIDVENEEFEQNKLENEDKIKTNSDEIYSVEEVTAKEEKISKVSEDISSKNSTKTNSDVIVDSFFNENKEVNNSLETIDSIALESKIKELLANSCFEIDTIEVDIEESTAYVFIDGDDAALLIGKEGYRYNALSYLLFNWINAKYGLYLKLEIAQFLASQQDMIKHQMKPVIEHVTREGWGKTRELNGILVQIALEHLRDTFPNKYVAIKRNRNGERYIVINEFNKK